MVLSGGAWWDVADHFKPYQCLEAMEVYLRTLTASINQPRELEVVTTQSCRVPSVLSVSLFNYHTNVALTVMLMNFFHATETSERAPLCAGCAF